MSRSVARSGADGGSLGLLNAGTMSGPESPRSHRPSDVSLIAPPSPSLSVISVASGRRRAASLDDSSNLARPAMDFAGDDSIGIGLMANLGIFGFAGSSGGRQRRTFSVEGPDMLLTRQGSRQRLLSMAGDLAEPSKPAGEKPDGDQSPKPVDARHRVGLSPIQAGVTLIKCAVGAGSFALPAAFMNGGLLGSFLGTIFLGIISAYTVVLLGRCEQLLVQQLQDEAREERRRERKEREKAKAALLAARREEQQRDLRRSTERSSAAAGMLFSSTPRHRPLASPSITSPLAASPRLTAASPRLGGASGGAGTLATFSLSPRLAAASTPRLADIPPLTSSASASAATATSAASAAEVPGGSSSSSASASSSSSSASSASSSSGAKKGRKVVPHRLTYPEMGRYVFPMCVCRFRRRACCGAAPAAADGEGVKESLLARRAGSAEVDPAEMEELELDAAEPRRKMHAPPAVVAALAENDVVEVNVLEWTICVGIILTSLGVCAAYVDFISGTLPSVWHQVTNQQYAAMMVPVVLFLALLRSFKFLSLTSVLGDIAVTAALIAVVVDGLITSKDGLNWGLPLFHFDGFFSFIGSSAFLFAIQIVVLPIMQAMAEPSKFAQVTYTSYSIITILNAVFGALCFMLFGEATQSPVLENLSDNWFLHAIRLLLCIDLILTFPMILAASRDILEQIFVPGASRYAHNVALFSRKVWCTRVGWIENATRTVLVGLVFLITFLVPDFGDMVSLIGGFVNCFMGFVLPPLIYMKVAGAKGKISRIGYVVNFLVVCFGLAVMVLSTKDTAKSIKENFSK